MAGQALIDPGRFLDVLGMEVRLMLDASRRLEPRAPVPTTPGLTVDELVRHVGGVYRVARLWILEGRSPRQQRQVPALGQSTEDYVRAGLAELLEVFRERGPQARVATWWPADPTCGFWYRRMAHETTIHRVDIENVSSAIAAKIPSPRGGTEPDLHSISPIAEDFALDGVDEALSLWFGQRLALLGLSGTEASTVGVHTDGQYWIARAGPGYTEAWQCSATEAEAADVLISGTPVHVYLWLWGRRSHHAVTWEGSDDAAAQFWALMRLATR